MIRNRYTNEIIFEDKECKTIKDEVEKAIKKGINLQGADMEGANLQGANMRVANMGGANMGGANMENANMEGAILCNCYFYNTIISFRGKKYIVNMEPFKE